MIYLQELKKEKRKICICLSVNTIIRSNNTSCSKMYFLRNASLSLCLKKKKRFRRRIKPQILFLLHFWTKYHFWGNCGLLSYSQKPQTETSHSSVNCFYCFTERRRPFRNSSVLGAVSAACAHTHCLRMVWTCIVLKCQILDHKEKKNIQ